MFVNSGIIFITALCSHCSHNQYSFNRSYQSKLYSSSGRLLLIDYCITNLAVIKYSSNALRTIQRSSNYPMLFELFFDIAWANPRN